MRLRSPRFRSIAWLAPIAAIVAGGSLTACGDYRLQVGLANVTNLNQPWTPEDFDHDVISNGDESCPRSGRAEDDPLMRRFPPCGGSVIYFGDRAAPLPPRAPPPKVRRPPLAAPVEMFPPGEVP